MPSELQFIQPTRISGQTGDAGFSAAARIRQTEPGVLKEQETTSASNRHVHSAIMPIWCIADQTAETDEPFAEGARERLM